MEGLPCVSRYLLIMNDREKLCDFTLPEAMQKCVKLVCVSGAQVPEKIAEQFFEETGLNLLIET